MEKLLKDAIVDHLEENHLIKETLHGFRKGKSCVTNMLQYWDKITGYVDKGIPVDVVYLDLQKAFDTVPHNRLMKKVQAHGIEGPILRWITEWLKNRKQRVVLDGVESEWKNVTSSVVQGSVLGPICFTIFMNDMDLDVNSELSKFADDTKVIRPIKRVEDRESLQDDINKLMEWTTKWQMSFNTAKCTVLHFGYGNPNPNYTYYMNGKALSSKEEEKDLGIYVSTSLKFGKQCAEAAKKANRVVGIIKRNFTNFDKDIMMKLYK